MTDQWASWLLNKRFGGDPTTRDNILPQLQEFRDKVLDGAHITPTDTVLDVGTGDGLLGLAALHRAATVIFSDVSQALLDKCRQAAQEIKAGDARFVHCGLPHLEPIPDQSVDVAMTRSVLIYVPDKPLSFKSLHRVLRPGGRLSIFEPINRFGHPEPDNILWGCDVQGLESLVGKVKEAIRKYRHAPMVDFDERDLVDLAEAAGFETVRLEYRAYVGSAEETLTWPTFLKIAPNPLVPTYGEMLAEALDEDEYETVAGHLRERLPARRSRRAGAYLTATR